MEEICLEELPYVEERTPVHGVPKSGRTWKTKQKKATKHKPVHSSWKKKVSIRDATTKVKEIERKILEDRAKLIEQKKKQLKEREERKLINERKAEVVQVVSHFKLEFYRFNCMEMLDTTFCCKTDLCPGSGLAFKKNFY
ncbi:Cgr1 domain containing protein [Trichuris trichiura]|uniref:Coiled-coil domain-containing protein 86 n=1 Tax=Trichuris trichiura TaxID=36087 RepID=A0A077YZR8_TRITR|nr:Cgr1 domain containing protein [Trichuris trichiura]